MLQIGDGIEVSTMNYVFDMFGKSVSQILQASINQQIAIDELRAQLRSVQTQLSNVCGTLEEFEDKIFVKIQEMRPTIYTRDGIPLDDALEMVQNKVSMIGDRTQSQIELIERIDTELKTKVDNEDFENLRSEIKQPVVLSDMSSGIQLLQKDINNQKQEMNLISDRILSMVQFKLDSYSSSRNVSLLVEDANDEYVTKKYVDSAISKIMSNSTFLLDLDPDVSHDASISIENAFSLLQLQQDRLDQMYRLHKEKIALGYNTLLSRVQEEEDVNNDIICDDFIIESNESQNQNSEERVVKNIGIDIQGNITDNEASVTRRYLSFSKRNVGLNCKPENEIRSGRIPNIIDDLKKERARAELGPVKLRNASPLIDEGKLASNITTHILSKVEGMLVDFFSMKGPGINLDRKDAKAIVQELTVLQTLKEDIGKLKVLMKMKMDLTKAEQEFDLRLTRDEFFSFIGTIFPNNSSVKKAIAILKNSSLPPLKSSPRGNKDKTNQDEDIKASTVLSKSQKPMTASPNLVPARNSRLLALNQKFLRGADGRYYLRDVSSELSQNFSSVPNKNPPLTPDTAFDFQPFIPPNQITKLETDYSYNPKQRISTPPKQND